MPKNENHKRYSIEEKYLVVENEEKNNLTLAKLSLKHGITQTMISGRKRESRENKGILGVLSNSLCINNIGHLISKLIPH